MCQPSGLTATETPPGWSVRWKRAAAALPALLFFKPRIVASRAAAVQPAGATLSSAMDKEGLIGGLEDDSVMSTGFLPACGSYMQKQGNGRNDPSQSPPAPGVAAFQRLS